MSNMAGTKRHADGNDAKASKKPKYEKKSGTANNGAGKDAYKLREQAAFAKGNDTAKEGIPNGMFMHKSLSSVRLLLENMCAPRDH